MTIIHKSTDWRERKQISDALTAVESDVSALQAAIAASSPANSVTATVNFGSAFTDKATAVVTGQAWVTANSEITAQVLCPAGTDPDEFYLLRFSTVISAISPGAGFTVTVYSEPEAKGSYSVMCIGV